MRIVICAVGRLHGRSEERALVDDYTSRFTRIGRQVGLGRFEEHEVEHRGGDGPAGEAAALRKHLPAGAVMVALDERGKDLRSTDLAARLAEWRDQARDVAFVIGGADGLDPALRAQADLALRFGQMVWPHALARVMLAEQLYRAATILAGTPYHRA